MNKANPSKFQAMRLTRTSTLQNRSFLGFALFIILILFCRVDVLVSHSAGSFLGFALFIILILFCRVDVLVSHIAGNLLGFALFIIN
jgi:ABC-type multidrug transport system permease subunit